jgi:hypothetical protein
LLRQRGKCACLGGYSPRTRCAAKYAFGKPNASQGVADCNP